MTAAPRNFGIDDDLDEMDDAPQLDHDTADGSDLNAILAELTATVVPTIDLEVPTRAGWVLRVRADFGSRQVDHWRKLSKDRKLSDGFDGGKFAALVIGANTTAILRHGEPLVIDGTEQTFTTKELAEVLDGATVADRVRTLYALDGYLDAAAKRVLAEAGFGEEATTADPTA